MCFEHNLNYVHNSLHLTRWVAPYPQYTSGIALTSPNKVSMVKTKKITKCHRYLSLSSIFQIPQQTHRCINLHDSSPRHSAPFCQFSPRNPTQSKATHILSNFGSHPFTKQKMHSSPQLHWLPQSYPLTYWCVKSQP